MEGFLVAAGLVLAAFVAGVALADKVKAWFKTEAASAEATVKADASVALDKVKSKL